MAAPGSSSNDQSQNSVGHNTNCNTRWISFLRISYNMSVYKQKTKKNNIQTACLSLYLLSHVT